MSLKFYLTTLSTVFLLMACQPKKSKTTTSQNQITTKANKADEIIDLAIKAHGGNHYKNHLYSFNFRDKEYSVINKKSSYTYTVKSTTENKSTIDVLDNGKFSRTINNTIVDLSKKKSSQYASALNSVIYFALLPYKLNDASVNKSYKGIVNIKNKDYHAIKVTFNKEGGGEDHDDIFYYWINTQNNRVDYLAYKYHVNGGGIRFREAFNTRNVNNVLFQDYINYKADPTLNLDDLPTLYNKNQLVEVSRIELKNVELVN